ncbi:MAG: arginase family protein [Bacteriovoracaceae bacterium]|nr:arginase family protein [Bacteriovoracaceae bacterium]
MTKPAITQSQKRFQESVGALFSADAGKTPATCLFLKSSSDIGVMRNGGRNGARFAPQSFLATFKKFAQDKTLSQMAFHDFEVAASSEEETDFHRAQEQEAFRIAGLIKQFPQSRICHIGGGHDHVYPLLRALSENYAKVVVLNIDAHADTRTDENHHSGTPFRQFAEGFQGQFSLYQLGLHSFANSFSTLSPLSKGKLRILWRNEVTTDALDLFFKEMEREIDEKTLVIFSLDADALSGAEVPGVSAVNPSGLGRTELLEIWMRFQKLPIAHSPIMGIYELNPLYDTLSSFSMRTLASFVYESLE